MNKEIMAPEEVELGIKLGLFLSDLLLKDSRELDSQEVLESLLRKAEISSGCEDGKALEDKFANAVAGLAGRGRKALLAVRKELNLDALFPRRDLGGLLGRAFELGLGPAAVAGLVELLPPGRDGELLREFLEASGVASHIQRAIRELSSEGRRIKVRRPPGWEAAIEALVRMIGEREVRMRKAEARAEKAAREVKIAQEEAERFRELLQRERAGRQRQAPAAVPAFCSECARFRTREKELEEKVRGLERELARAQGEAEKIWREAELSAEAAWEAARQAWALSGAEGEEEELPPGEEAPRLSGLRVLVVGDEARKERYRKEVERTGAEFLFHPGFDQEARLHERLKAADAVVALADFMSHKAHAIVRGWEKGTGLPVAWVARTGVGALRRGLELLEKNKPIAPQRP